MHTSMWTASELSTFVFRLTCALGLLTGLVSCVGRVHGDAPTRLAVGYGSHLALGLAAGAVAGLVAGWASASLLARR